MSAIRVIVVEPEPLLSGVVHDLDHVEGIEVVASGSSGADALQLIRQYVPDVAVLGIQLPDISGLKVLEELGQEEIKVLFLTQEESKGAVIGAMGLGARGYLLKWYSDIPLEEGVRRVHEGQLVVDSQALILLVGAIKKMAEEAMGAGHKQLSYREKQVLTLLARGRTQRQVASLLNITEHTVRAHCRNIYGKLDARNQTAAVAVAQRLGYI